MKVAYHYCVSSDLSGLDRLKWEHLKGSFDRSRFTAYPNPDLTLNSLLFDLTSMLGDRKDTMDTNIKVRINGSLAFPIRKQRED